MNEVNEERKNGVKRKSPLVINLLGGPGCGKSTSAAGLFYKLKNQLVSCELVAETAKMLVYEKRFETLSNQMYVFGSQLQSQMRIANQVDVIVTDSPLPLTLFYKPEEYPASFDDFVLWSFNQFDNMNYFIDRKKPYVKLGRYQDEPEARQLDTRIKSFLDVNGINYSVVPGNPDGLDLIVDDVMNRLHERKTKS